jgi:pyruvate/2-oxoglutarate dehydrogenase complex dihydrolipoamide acyltransferase (E2) component
MPKMIKDRSARWTAGGALAAALLSLGLSSWAIGCSERSEIAEPELVAAPRSAAAAAPASTRAEAVVEPVAAAAKLAAPAAPTVKPQVSEQPLVADALAVRRLVVTHTIENREPVSGELRIGEQPIVAFLELTSSAPVEQTVTVSFERAGTAVGLVKLSVPAHSRRWRTWAQTRRIREPGAWDAVVRSQEGQELSRTKFQVVK